MFRSLDDFSTAWDQERDGTLKVLRALTDVSLSQPIIPGVPVPGKYGPSREEWVAMGVPPLP